MTVSIITVNYNDCDGLSRTLDSVLCQSCNDYEWIVIDGASSDGSKDLLAKNSDKISYWVSEPDKGIYHAMNKGIDASRGDYLIFMNSGDAFYDEDVIRDFLARDNREDVIYGREIGVDRSGRCIWQWQFPKEPLRLSYFFGKTLKHQATFFSRRCFDRFRYNEAHKINSDVELFMNLLYHGYSFAQFDRLIAKFDVCGLSSDKENLNKEKSEFNDTIRRLMPAGMIADYKDLLKSQDNDLMLMMHEITSQSRFSRMMARVLVYPLYHVLRLFNKKHQ